MNNTLKDTFDQIHAEDELKNRTREYLFRKTNGYTGVKKKGYRYWIPAAACFIFLLWGGHWLYFTPTAEISIDINPSLELEINRFDRVIGVESYNDDGQELADSLDIRHLNYTEAVEQIMENDMVAALLSDDEVMVIGVIGSNEEQSARILAEVQTCTEEETNTYCYSAHSDEAEEAHEMGLSCGKYRAFLELQKLDPTITVEEVQDMTMREIYDRMEALSGNIDAGTDGTGEDNSAADYREEDCDSDEEVESETESEHHGNSSHGQEHGSR